MKLMEETMADKAEKVWAILGLAGLDDFTALMEDLMGDTVDLSDEEIKKFVTMTLPLAASSARRIRSRRNCSLIFTSN